MAAYLAISGLNYHNKGSGCWGINQVKEAQICLNSFNFFCSHHLPQWDCYLDNSMRSKRNLHGIFPHKMYWSWHVWSHYQKEGLWADQARGWQMSLHISASYFYLYIDLQTVSMSYLSMCETPKWDRSLFCKKAPTYSGSVLLNDSSQQILLLCNGMY